MPPVSPPCSHAYLTPLCLPLFCHVYPTPPRPSPCRHACCAPPRPLPCCPGVPAALSPCFSHVSEPIASPPHRYDTHPSPSRRTCRRIRHRTCHRTCRRLHRRGSPPYSPCTPAPPARDSASTLVAVTPAAVQPVPAAFGRLAAAPSAVTNVVQSAHLALPRAAAPVAALSAALAPSLCRPTLLASRRRGYRHV